jgi:hypothetical protein
VGRDRAGARARQQERTLDLLWSPEAVLSEGIAETGPELVVGRRAGARGRGARPARVRVRRRDRLARASRRAT